MVALQSWNRVMQMQERGSYANDAGADHFSCNHEGNHHKSSHYANNHHTSYNYGSNHH
jgi:hypothetical protein